MKTKLKSDWILLVAYIYVLMPMLLFALLWLRPAVAVVLGAALLYGLYRSLCQETPVWKPEWNRKTLLLLIIAIAAITLWVLTSGIGGSIDQHPDHIYRNGLFKMLIDRPWPVYNASGEKIVPMSYYIGFWLPAAFFGKLTSYPAAMLFMQIWSVIGLVLIWYFICEKQQRWQLWFLLVFIFFGGLDPIGRLLSGGAYTQVGNRYEWWATTLNYPGNSSHLFWVYNQVIYAWLIYLLIMRQKNNKSLMFLWSNMLLTCTFPAVGMIPFVIYRAIANTEAEKAPHRVKTAFRRCLTTQNWIGFGSSVVAFLYLASNRAILNTMPSFFSKLVHAAGDSFSGISYTDGSFASYPITTKIWTYLLFILLEIGIYYMLIYKSEKKKPIYWFSLILLLVIPWIKVGYWIDFSMRASIPALLGLFELIISALQRYRAKRDFVRLSLLIGMLGIASLTTVDTIVGVMQPTELKLYEDKRPKQLIAKDIYVINGDNFSASYDTIFFKYLARPADPEKTLEEKESS